MPFFLSGCFYTTLRFWFIPVGCISMKVVYTFLFLHSIPCYRYFIICLFIHFLKDSWIFQLWLLGCASLCRYLFHFSKSRIAGSYGKCLLNFGKIVSYEVVQFYIPASNVWMFLLLYILSKHLNCLVCNFGKL